MPKLKPIHVFNVFIFWLFYIMAADSLENRLRDALMRNVTELNNYRSLYKQSQNENANLRQISLDINHDNDRLLSRNLDLQEELDVKDKRIEHLQKTLDEYSIGTVYKSWNDIKSRSQKSRRKRKYRKCLNLVLRYFPDITAANVSMQLGSEWVNITFSGNDLEDPDGKCSDIISPKEIIQEHSYSKNVHLDEEENTEISNNYFTNVSDVLQSGGKISRRHIRSVANVVDLYKIPEKGYNELRLARRGILPTLSSLNRERLLMSNEIPFVVNPSVSKTTKIIAITHV